MLKFKWDQLEQNAFQDHKSHEIDFMHGSPGVKHCTLRSLREDNCLGSPPSAYYTNDNCNKSINALLKESLGYKKGVFNEKVMKIVKQQQCEMEKAIIGYGEYKLNPQYCYLAVSEDRWFKNVTGATSKVG